MKKSKRPGRWAEGLALLAIAVLPCGAQEPSEADSSSSETQQLVITPIAPSYTSATSSTFTAGSLPPAPVKELRFNFEGVPLDTVLNYMSQAAGFIIVRSADIEGRINVISQQPLNADQSVELLNTVLNEKGLAAIRNDRTLTIVSRDEAKRREIPVIKGNVPEDIPKSDKMVTQIIPVRYANAKQLVTDLSSLIPEHASMTANESSNTIVLTDTQSSVRRITEIIQGLDSSISEITTLRVFPLKFADAKATAELIKSLFTTNTGTQQSGDDMRRQFMQRFGGFGRGGGGGGGGGQGGEQNQNQNAESAALQAAAKVTAAADERTNSLVVSAPDETMSVIVSLVESIDTSTDSLTEVRVFPLKFADATQTADVIKGVFAAQTTAAQAAAQQQNQGGNRRFRGPQQQQPAATDTQSSRQKTESTVLAVPDTRTNSVIVSASESAIEQIASMVIELDKNPAKNKRVFVYSLKNANPEEVALVLEDMFGANATGGTSSSRSSTSSGSNARSGSNSNSNSNSNRNSSGSSNSTRGSSGSNSSR